MQVEEGSFLEKFIVKVISAGLASGVNINSNNKTINNYNITINNYNNKDVSDIKKIAETAFFDNDANLTNGASKARNNLIKKIKEEKDLKTLEVNEKKVDINNLKIVEPEEEPEEKIERPVEINPAISNFLVKRKKNGDYKIYLPKNTEERLKYDENVRKVIEEMEKEKNKQKQTVAEQQDKGLKNLFD